jgi:hypothetical protein
MKQTTETQPKPTYARGLHYKAGVRGDLRAEGESPWALYPCRRRAVNSISKPSNITVSRLAEYQGTTQSQIKPTAQYERKPTSVEVAYPETNVVSRKVKTEIVKPTIFYEDVPMLDRTSEERHISAALLRKKAKSLLVAILTSTESPSIASH